MTPERKEEIRAYVTGDDPIEDIDDIVKMVYELLAAIDKRDEAETEDSKKLASMLARDAIRIAKARKVIEAAREVLKKNDDGAWAIIVDDWDLEPLEKLQDALDEWDEVAK